MRKISKTRLNKNERFCCTLKDVKEIFGGENICVYYGRTSKEYYKKPGAKCVASLSIRNLDSDPENIGDALLSFDVLKNSEYSEEMRKEFIDKILPKIYEGYLKHKDGNPGNINGCYYFSVGLYNGQFITNEGIT